MKKVFTLLILLTSVGFIYGQSVSLQGYVFEANNRGYINQVKVDILEAETKVFITSVMTDKDGFFKADLPAGKNFFVRANKDLFLNEELVVEAKGVEAGGKKFVNLEMERKPGYIFDVTMADPRPTDEVIASGIHGATVEVYNNTIEEEVLRFVDFEFPNFKVTFEQGNHYTILLRKEGYYAKRMEAYVNVKGCILCFDGVGSVQPGVSDVLTAGHQMGTLLANVELKPIVLDEKTKLENILYKTGSAKLNQAAKNELRTVMSILKDNPGMKVELSSHTDSRGEYDMNMNLSKERAKVAREYIASFTGVEANSVIGRGYGESRLDNGCSDGVPCNERQHQRNRRTEIKLLEFNQEPKERWKPLAELKRLERMELLLEDLQNQEIVQIPADNTDQLPEDLKKQLGIKKNTANDAAKAETPKPSFDASNTTTASASEEEVIEMVNTPEKPQKTMEDIEREIEARAALANAKKIEIADEEDVVEEVGEATDVSEDDVTIDMADSKFKDLKAVPSAYSGYKIQVHQSAEKLPESHELFKVFGNLTIEKNSSGYAYLLGDFKESKDAALFLENIIKPRYPNAALVQFDDGRRLSN